MPSFINNILCRDKLSNSWQKFIFFNFHGMLKNYMRGKIKFPG